jgi:hypothetical protein
MADTHLAPVGWGSKNIAGFEAARLAGDEVIYTGKMVPDGSGGLIEQVVINPADVAPMRTYRPAPSVGSIYFVGPEGGPIKIGFASRLEFRLKDLRTMNAFPLIVHAVAQGSPRLERDYHKRFAEHRLHGEWFDPAPEILAEIDRINSEQAA